VAKARTRGRKFRLLLYCIRALDGAMVHVNQFCDDIFSVSGYCFQSCVIGHEERGVKTANGKIQKEQEQTEAQPDGA
jgi:hypothetical protein